MGIKGKVNTGMKTIERAQQKVESGKVSLASALDTLNANASMTALQVSASSTELANAALSLIHISEPTRPY